MYQTHLLKGGVVFIIKYSSLSLFQWHFFLEGSFNNSHLETSFNILINDDK
jgi:hypothetical protein